MVELPAPPSASAAEAVSAISRVMPGSAAAIAIETRTIAVVPSRALRARLSETTAQLRCAGRRLLGAAALDFIEPLPQNLQPELNDHSTT
jgi:hypothetical protein